MSDISLNRGLKSKLTYNISETYNQDGCILFAKDTNELFINDGRVDSSNQTNRKQINAKYALALWDYNGDTVDLAEIRRSYLDLKDAIKELEDNLATGVSAKMDKLNPTGTGVLSLGTNSKSISVSTGALIGAGLVQSASNNNAIITGQYNAQANNGLFVVGNGTGQLNRKNALVITRIDNSSRAVFEGDVYIGNSTQPSSRLVSKEELDTAVNNVITTPYIAQATEPTSDEDKKLLWIDTSIGNGVLKYWAGTAWKALSAVYS